MKALVGAFNQEKALVAAFSMIVKTDCETDEALHSTSVVTSVVASLKARPSLSCRVAVGRRTLQ